MPDPLLCCGCVVGDSDFGSVGYGDIGLWCCGWYLADSHITQKLPVQHLCQTRCCVVGCVFGDSAVGV